MRKIGWILLGCLVSVTGLAEDLLFNSTDLSLSCPDKTRPQFAVISYRDKPIREIVGTKPCKSYVAERSAEILVAQGKGVKLAMGDESIPRFKQTTVKNDTFVLDQKKFFDLLAENSSLKAKLQACEGRKSGNKANYAPSEPIPNSPGSQVDKPE